MFDIIAWTKGHERAHQNAPSLIETFQIFPTKWLHRQNDARERLMNRLVGNFLGRSEELEDLFMVNGIPTLG
jgi:hypothetical protein